MGWWGWGCLGFSKESSLQFKDLANHFPLLHREAAESFSLAAELGLSPGHAVLAGIDGEYTSLGGEGVIGLLREDGRDAGTGLSSVIVVASR